THQKSTYLHVVIGQNHVRFFELMRGEEGARVGPTFVFDARVDIELLIIEEVADHVCQSWWTKSIDTDRQTRYPGVVEEWPELQIMIGMVVGNEDVAKPVQCDARIQQLL